MPPPVVAHGRGQKEKTTHLDYSLGAQKNQGEHYEDHKRLYIKDYEDALEGAGPKLKELILERAVQEHSIDFVELKRLVDRAYPEQA